MKRAVGNIDRLVSNASFDAGEPCRNDKEVDKCKRVSKNSRNKSTAEELFVKQSLRIKSGLSVSEAVPYNKDFLAALRRQMKISSSQNLLSRSRNVLKETLHHIATLNDLAAQKKVRKKLMASEKSDT